MIFALEGAKSISPASITVRVSEKSRVEAEYGWREILAAIMLTPFRRIEDERMILLIIELLKE